MKHRLNYGEMLISGSLFVVAVYFFWYSFDLDMGSLRRPGPGAAPLVCAILLGILSAAMFAMFSNAAEPDDDIKIKSVLLCIAGILTWAVMARSTGLLPSTFAITLIVSLADRPWKPLRTFMTFGVILGVTYLLFIQILSAPIAFIGDY